MSESYVGKFNLYFDTVYFQYEFLRLPLLYDGVKFRHQLPLWSHPLPPTPSGYMCWQMREILFKER